jgi:hypothetical protein
VTDAYTQSYTNQELMGRQERLSDGEGDPFPTYAQEMKRRQKWARVERGGEGG